MPKRIQRRRTKGWRMPEGAIYVGRPTRWGNPYRITGMSADARAQAVQNYREAVPAWPAETIADIRHHLGGRDLACWCPLDLACHADVLLDIANGTD